MIEFFLTWARDEILWYFGQHDKVIGSFAPKLLPKAPAVNQGNDHNILQLIGLVIELRTIIFKHQNEIADFYSQKLANLYAPKLEALGTELINSGIGDLLSQVITTSLADIKNANSESRFTVRLITPRLV